MSRAILHRDFVRDLGRGAIGEDVAVAFLEKEYGVEVKNVSERNSYWDLEVVGITEEVKGKKKVVSEKLLEKFHKSFGHTIEVKLDSAAAQHKNFFIEILFDIENGVAGAITKCKADIFIFIVPEKRKFRLYIFKRPEFLSWLIAYLILNKKKIEFKTPGISPRARGIPLSIEEAKNAFGYLGEFEFKF